MAFFNGTWGVSELSCLSDIVAIQGSKMQFYGCRLHKSVTFVHIQPLWEFEDTLILSLKSSTFLHLVFLECYNP